MKTVVTITQDELDAIHTGLTIEGEPTPYQLQQHILATKVVANLAQEIYEVWDALPDGSALKEVYRDDVWHPEHTE